MTLATNSRDRYAGLSVGLHWLMLGLIAAVYAAIELRELFPKGSDPRELLKSAHYLLGLCVLALAVGRLGVRLLAGAPPPIEPVPSPWMRWSARAMVLALYGLMLAMPLMGLALLGADGKTLALFGQALPPLLAPDEGLAEVLEEAHETLGNIGYGLIGLHAAAALFHHYVRRDNTLARMLPRLG